MLKKYGVGLAFVGALTFGVCTVNTVLVGSVMASQEEENKVDIAQTPSVVQAVIKKENAGGAVKEIVVIKNDGVVTYVVKYTQGGMEKTLHIKYRVIDSGVYVEYIKNGMEKTVGFTDEGKTK